MNKKIYIIAGEDSGDKIGGFLIQRLKEAGAQINIIGGKNMESQGLKSLFDIKQISVMGFLEILPKLPKMFSLLKMAENDITQKKPDVLVTIDSPGFNLQIAKRIKKKLPNTKLVHYVAPTVWAYKEKRALKFAKYYNLMLLLLDFEKPYFDKVGLKSVFVGHPIWEKEDETKALPRQNIIAFMLGSRVGEVKKHLKIFLPLLKKLKAALPNYSFYVLATENTKDLLKGIDINVVVDENEKLEVIKKSHLAIVKSGTGTLEFIKQKTPIIVFYKMNPISVFLLKKLLKIKYVNLVNILANKMLIPELIQQNATADNIFEKTAEAISNNLYSPNEAYLLLQRLKPNENITPSKIARDAILSI